MKTSITWAYIFELCLEFRDEPARVAKALGAGRDSLKEAGMFPEILDVLTRDVGEAFSLSQIGSDEGARAMVEEIVDRFLANHVAEYLAICFNTSKRDRVAAFFRGLNALRDADLLGNNFPGDDSPAMESVKTELELAVHIGDQLGKTVELGSQVIAGMLLRHLGNEQEDTCDCPNCVARREKADQSVEPSELN